MLADNCAVDIIDAHGSIRRVAEAYANPGYRRPPAHPRHFPPGPTRRRPGELIIPLRSRGKLLGAISFNMASSGRKYNHVEIGMAEELGRQAAMAIDNALLFKAQLEATERMAWLVRTTAALAEARTAQEAGHLIAEHAREAFGAATAIVFSLEEGGQLLRQLAIDGDHHQRVEATTEPHTATRPVSSSVREGRHCWVENREQIRERFPGGRAYGVSSAEALIDLALCVKRRAIGSLVLAFFEPRQFSDQDRQFADAWAQQCAQVLHRALLVERERNEGERGRFPARADERFASLLELELDPRPDQ
jgi:GAF domain-containing protein